MQSFRFCGPICIALSGFVILVSYFQVNDSEFVEVNDE